MKPQIPLLKFPQFSTSDDLSPRSEEFREATETYKFPFLFQSYETTARFPNISYFTQASKSSKLSTSSEINTIHSQSQEITILRNSNKSLEKQLEDIENDLRKFRRLRILLREKDRKIKELELSLEILTDEIRTIQEVPTLQIIHEKSRPVSTLEFYAKNPCRRVWTHPAPEFVENLNKLKEKIKTVKRHSLILTQNSSGYFPFNNF